MKLFYDTQKEKESSFLTFIPMNLYYAHSKIGGVRKGNVLSELYTHRKMD